MKERIWNLLNSKKYSLIFIYTVCFISHVSFFNLPPQGAHIWRQCNTSAVSRNFVEEDMNIFKPRVDRRYNTNGVTGMQFPSFEFAVASICKIIGGYHESVNRVVAFSFFCIGLYFMYSFLFFIKPSNVFAALGTWAFMASPVLFYHSINALPDILALSASIGGLYYFLKWNKSFEIKWVLLSLFWTTLAGLTKLQYLAIGFPIITLFIQGMFQRRYSINIILITIAYGIIACITSISWYIYAAKLIETSGLADFGLILRPVYRLDKIIEIVLYNIFKDLPEYILGFTSVIGFGVGLYTTFKKKFFKNSTYFLPFLVWCIALIVYYALEIEEMEVHTYYLFPLFIILYVIVGYGLEILTKKYLWLVLSLSVLMPLNAFLRIQHHWTNGHKRLPTEFQTIKNRRKIESIIPPEALTIVGADGSGCIYHYFTHTKGFTFGNATDLLHPKKGFKTTIEYYISIGASYIIIDKKELDVTPLLKKYLLHDKSFDNTLCIYSLKQ